MFFRKLKPDEQSLLERIEKLVQATTRGAMTDPPQVFEVLKFAVAISNKVPEPINPLLLTATALLHQVGNGMLPPGPAGGFMGASIVESFLRSTHVSDAERVQIIRAVTSVSSPDMLAPETVEEKVITDAVELESWSMLGVLRVVRGSGTNLGEYIKSERTRRKACFEKLHYDASREVGQPIFRQGEIFLKTVEQAYYGATSRLKDAGLPV